ncbi:MAG: glycoside hydrolase family 88 protein [Ignavibacteriae bacterium]|nr:glycoside hydrolase family 88 protein [Ignavibacteriota bacterium]
MKKAPTKSPSLLICLFTIVLSAQGQVDPHRDLATINSTQPWSYRIAESFLLRHPGAVTYDTGFTEQKWNYEQGLMLWAFYQMSLHSGRKEFYDFIETNLDQYVDEDGSIRLYKRTNYNLDLVAPGRSLLLVYAKTRKEKFKRAADTLRQQLREQPRTNEGGFWHKQIYPYQMWLDGLYMAEPFYAMYAKLYNDKQAFDDIANQFIWIARHTRDDKTGLYYHGWDESKQMPWADSATGRSPSFWGRAMGWYIMGLVDVIEYFPAKHPKRMELIGILSDVANGLLKWRDPNSHLWYLVLDQGTMEGNYLESSSATMFTYAFAKGARLKYLDKKFAAEAGRSFEGILRHHVTIDSNGFVNLHHTIKGAGLGGKPYRDGTFTYYTSEGQRTNDMKAVGPFLLAAIEIEKMAAKRPSKK